MVERRQSARDGEPFGWRSCATRLQRALSMLTGDEVMLHYLRDTTTQTGLRVRAHLVAEAYQTGERITDEEMALLCLEAHAVCPQWNYTIRPRAPVPEAAEGG